VTLNSIPAKAPGESVTISGATNLDEVSIKVIRPDSTILYVEVITASNGAYTHTFDLPEDAQAGAYTVVAGQGNNVATTTFAVTTSGNDETTESGGSSDGSSNGSGSNGGGSSSNGSTEDALEQSGSSDQELTAPAGGEAQPSRTTFADIQGHWAQNEIEIMAGQGIARGVGDKKFNPDGQVTRAEFATFLLRSLGLEENAPEKGNFTDVAAGSWYYGAVETAYANGLVSGYEDGAFRPEAKITRQEIAAMVTRALNKDGQQIEVEDAESVLSTFADGSIISSWARGSVATAVEAGILRGRGDSLIAPQANATRAEAVVMLYRMLVYLGRL